MTRTFLMLPIALALIVAACGGGDDSSSATSVSPENYAKDLENIVERVENRLDELTADLDAAGDADSLDEILTLVASIVPDIIAVIEDGTDDIAALQPPAQFRADHDRFVKGLRELLAVQSEFVDAADDGNLFAFADIGTRAEQIEDELEADLSPEFRKIVQDFFDDDD